MLRGWYLGLELASQNCIWTISLQTDSIGQRFGSNRIRIRSIGYEQNPRDVVRTTLASHVLKTINEPTRIPTNGWLVPRPISSGASGVRFWQISYLLDQPCSHISPRYHPELAYKQQ